jgi:chemotaxis signal transduction protein
MTAVGSGLAERAEEMRADFDRGFAAARRVDIAAKHDLIAIRVGTEPFAIRLTEVSGLFADRKITRVPGSHNALLGIAGFRGALVPVYGLRALLRQSGTQSARWLVIAAAAPVAFAFDTFEGHLRVAADAILKQQSQAQSPSYALEFIRTDDLVRPVLHLRSVIDALGASDAAKSGFTKE